MGLGSGNLRGQFLRYVIPSVAAQWVYALYNMVDGLVVARGVGETALTAVNLSNPFIQFMFALSLLFAAGASTVTSIYLGRGERRQASEVFSQNVAFQLVLGAVIAAVLLPNLGAAARFLGARDEVTQAYVVEYLGYVVPFAPAFLLSYCFEVLIKADGFPRKAVVLVLLGAVENCVLDWLFVMVLDKGVGGAAFATGFSQLTLTLLYLAHFRKGTGVVRFVRFRPRLSLFFREVRNGFSAALTEMSSGAVTLMFNRVILRFLSPDALVSYAIVSYINTLTVFSVTGVAQGAQPLVSYSFGRQDGDTCRWLLRRCLGTAAVFCAGAVAVCALFAGQIAACYIGPDLPALRASAAAVIRIFSLSFLFLGGNVVLSGYLAAVEQAGPAIAISAGRGFVLLAVSLLVLTALFGGAGIWWAPLAAEAATLCMSVVLFLRYRRSSFSPG